MSLAGGAGTRLLLGVDAGGTCTSAWIADETGAIRARAEGGAANYQSIGAATAREALADVVERALGQAGATAADLAWAGYGVAGADRPKDFAAVEALLPALPAAGQRCLVNDTELVLRAGTPDGVGIALISGTGTNAHGRGVDGRRASIGGMGYELGDFGSAIDLGREAIRLAMRGRDGRGPPTALYDRLCEALGLEVLEDVVDRWMEGGSNDAEAGKLAPLVFDTAAAGDAGARGLLVRAGEELALSGRLLLDQLFDDRDSAIVVLGGSVLQQGYGIDPTLVDTIARQLATARTEVRLHKLAVEPVVGALLLAQDGHVESPRFEAGLRGALGTERTVPIPLPRTTSAAADR